MQNVRKRDMAKIRPFLFVITPLIVIAAIYTNCGSGSSAVTNPSQTGNPDILPPVNCSYAANWVDIGMTPVPAIKDLIRAKLTYDTVTQRVVFPASLDSAVTFFNYAYGPTLGNYVYLNPQNDFVYGSENNVAGWNGVVLQSTDKGANFFPFTTLPNAELKNIQGPFFDRKGTLYYGGVFVAAEFVWKVYRVDSATSGTYLDSVGVNGLDTAQPSTMYFNPNGHMYVSGSSQYGNGFQGTVIRRSTDGGATWSTVEQTHPAGTETALLASPIIFGSDGAAYYAYTNTDVTQTVFAGYTIRRLLPSETQFTTWAVYNPGYKFRLQSLFFDSKENLRMVYNVYGAGNYFVRGGIRTRDSAGAWTTDEYAYPGRATTSFTISHADTSGNILLVGSAGAVGATPDVKFRYLLECK